MNCMRLFMISAVLTVAGGWNTLGAQDKLSVHPAGSGAVWETALAEIQRVSFSDSGVTFTNRGGQEAYSAIYGEIGKIVLALSGTGSGIPVMGDGLRLHVVTDSDYLRVTGWSTGEKGRMDIYSAGGTLCVTMNEWYGEPVRISSLPRGFYILRINDQTFKFRKS